MILKCSFMDLVLYQSYFLHAKSHIHNIHKIEEDLLLGKPPTCPLCGAVVKPDIVFFGEDLPDRFRTSFDPDFSSCDLLIVMGTSLQVQPISSLIHRVPETTPRLLVGADLSMSDFFFPHSEVAM